MSVDQILSPRRRTGLPIADRGSAAQAPGSDRHRAAVAAARGSRWLAAQPDDFVAALLRAARLRSYTRDVVIIGVQDEPTALHFLLEGGVQVAMPRVTQEMTVVHLVTPHQWFGEMSAIPGVPSAAEYRACSRCVTLSIPRADIATLQRQSAANILPMLELLSDSARRFGEIAADHAGLDPAGRVVSKLLSLSAPAAAATERGAVRLAVSQSQLGELCSVSRTTVCKVLGQLAGEGAIAIRYGGIEVLSRARLVAALRQQCP